MMDEYHPVVAATSSKLAVLQKYLDAPGWAAELMIEQRHMHPA
jgi:hypothetical protein